MRSDERGVFAAYDFGTSTPGCAARVPVILKMWPERSSRGRRELDIYKTQLASVINPGIATLLWHGALGDDATCIVMPRLGPTLQDVQNYLPSKKLSAKMVMAIAIQLVRLTAHSSLRLIRRSHGTVLYVAFAPGRAASARSHP